MGPENGTLKDGFPLQTSGYLGFVAPCFCSLWDRLTVSGLGKLRRSG